LKKNYIIAIDGPAGSGKSTIARMVAKRLDYLYIDTGAMYRALTFKALETKVSLHDPNNLIKLATKTDIKLKVNDNNLQVLLDSKDVTSRIREPEVTRNVVYVANIPEVRKIMVELQRNLGRKGGVVIEGRDVTTVVFPNAQRKFYLDASFEERLERRYKQLISEGKNISKGDLAQDIKDRDISDRERKVGALKKAKDAVYLDTSKLNIEEVVDEVLSYV
jgi:cytidylate kinase